MGDWRQTSWLFSVLFACQVIISSFSCVAWLLSVSLYIVAIGMNDCYYNHDKHADKLNTLCPEAGRRNLLILSSSCTRWPKNLGKE